jgi:EmrB/QacA subfamily drug resistance transporter
MTVAKSPHLDPANTGRGRITEPALASTIDMRTVRARPAPAVGIDQLTHRRRWKILAVLSLSLVIVSLDNTVLNVALPSVQRSLHATAGDLQWIVDAYTLVFAGLVLLGGTLGDRFGRKRCLQIGLALLAGGSALAALADTTATLILARAVMGVGGALIMPATLSITTGVFTGSERAKAIGIWSACAGIGVAFGPVAGGWLVEHFWWGSVFLINVPFIAAALLGGLVLLPESRDPTTAPPDLLGAVLSTVGITALVYAIIAAPNDGWTSTSVLVPSGLALVSLAAFVQVERRSRYPMLPMSFFRSAHFSAASLSISLTFFSLMGSLFFLTQYLQIVRGYSSLAAGVRSIPVAVGLGLASAAAPALAARFGSRRIVAVGMALTGCGLALVALIRTGSPYFYLGGSLAIMGVGMGATMAPATSSIMASVPPARAGVGSAVNDSVRQLSGALGVAILGSFLQARYASNIRPRLGAIQGLTAATRHSVLDSVAGAHPPGQPPLPALAAIAQDAFISAMDTTVGVAAAVMIVGALAVARFLPNGEPAAIIDSAAPIGQGERRRGRHRQAGRHRYPGALVSPAPRLILIPGEGQLPTMRLHRPERQSA